MIDSSVIYEIKQRLNIIDVVSNQLSIKKQGNNHTGCCPFHDEKTPSFTVNEQKQFYYCFGCGASGDLIEFYKEFNGVSFNQSVTRLSAMAGIDVTRSDEKLVPAKVKEMITDDKIIIIMSKDYEKNGIKLSYKDKQRKRLAENRLEALIEKWGL